MLTQPQQALTNKEKLALKNLLNTFRQNWKDGLLEEWAKRLQAEKSFLRHLALLGMIRIDLLEQWRRGNKPTIENYLQQFPEFGRTKTAVDKLILTEWIARQRANDAETTVADFASRFSLSEEELHQLLKDPVPSHPSQSTKTAMDSEEDLNTKEFPNPQDAPTTEFRPPSPAELPSVLVEEEDEEDEDEWKETKVAIPYPATPPMPHSLPKEPVNQSHPKPDELTTTQDPRSLTTTRRVAMRDSSQTMPWPENKKPRISTSWIIGAVAIGLVFGAMVLIPLFGLLQWNSGNRVVSETDPPTGNPNLPKANNRKRPQNLKPAQVPILNSPKSEETLPNLNLVTGKSEWVFRWSEVEGATVYQLSLGNASVPNSTGTTIVPTPTYRHIIVGRGPNADLAGWWKWKVRAQVDGEWTEWSEERSFVVERQQAQAQLPVVPPQNPLIGKDAIPLEVETWVNGEPMEWSDLKGKVVLLDFWGFWCPYCVYNMPTLRQWHEKYEKEGLVLVGVTRYYGYDWDTTNKRPTKTIPFSPEKEREALVAFAEQYQLKYPFAIVPALSRIYQQYGVSGIPQMVLIDREGKIRMIRVGHSSSNNEAIESMMKKLLNEPTNDSGQK